MFNLFKNPIDTEFSPKRLDTWPAPPPWRSFMPQAELDSLVTLEADEERWNNLSQMALSDSLSIRRGKVFRLPAGCSSDSVAEWHDSSDYQTSSSSEGERVRLAVNAAIHLRRPLLVTGHPGSGKTSLAYAIAWELGLGPVLTWPINPRARLREDGLYGYDALARLQDTQMKSVHPIGNYITLGPVGTAFLPSRWPRVLLIDEIDKSDLQLPNELLNLFEEGRFTVEELKRHAETSASEKSILVRTADTNINAEIRNGEVRCHAFPIVVMTSNRERDFPAAFNRRCIRVEMPHPTQESLLPLVKAHFGHIEAVGNDSVLTDWIQQFLDDGKDQAMAIDQLLNSVFLRTHDPESRPSEIQIDELRTLLHKPPAEI